MPAFNQIFNPALIRRAIGAAALGALMAASSAAVAQTAPQQPAAAPAPTAAPVFDETEDCFLTGRAVFEMLDKNQSRHAAEQTCLSEFKNRQMKNADYACLQRCLNGWQKDYDKYSKSME